MKSSTWRSSAVLVTAGFALSGMLTGGLMQADVVSYERAFELNHEQVSIWLSLFSVLTAVGGAVAGVLADRVGAGKVYLGCLALSGAGLSVFAASHPFATLSGFILSSLGIGALIIGNILVTQDGSGSPNRSLNRLHANHSLARLIGVFISMYALTAFWKLSYVALGIAFFALAAIYRPPERIAPASKSAGSAPQNRFIFARPFPTVYFGFLSYMMAEMVLITWLPAYFEQDRQWTPAASKLVYAVFLAGLIVGRVYCSIRWPAEISPRACRILAIIHVCSMGMFIASSREWILCVSLFAAGFCEGPGWPSLFAFAARRAVGFEGKLTAVIYLVCCTSIVLATAGSGILAQRMGLASIFYVAAGAHLVFSGLFHHLLRRNPFSAV